MIYQKAALFSANVNHNLTDNSGSDSFAIGYAFWLKLANNLINVLTPTYSYFNKLPTVPYTTHKFMHKIDTLHLSQLIYRLNRRLNHKLAHDVRI